MIARAVLLAVPTCDDRPWSSAASTPKPLVPVAAKPILFHALDALRAAGIVETLLLTRPDAVAAFRHAVGDGTRWGMRISYCPNSCDLDVRDALRLAGEFIDGKPVIVQQADALLRACLRDHVVRFAEHDLDALALMLAPARLPRPIQPLVGGYLLNARAVASMCDGPVASDPLSGLRRQGGHAHVLEVEGCLACHGDEATLLEANRHALTALRTEVTDAILEGCEIQGNVVVHPTASLRNTLVRGPAIIGADAQVIDSYVGPYTSIGANTRIEGTEIEHSIVMDGAKLMFVGSRLETSIIGRGASIVRRFDMPRAVRMSIGDGAEVALS
ncbi:MAG: glucose-phosphate thymidylyltransferase [Solirubrobacteraceae bacterium]|jgi:glucose-1-phosphate thymidylyltransferase|nr:glucose-phosphate thymidylyltransferase [Solirubrobacteraceae bacterium]